MSPKSHINKWRKNFVIHQSWKCSDLKNQIFSNHNPQSERWPDSLVLYKSWIQSVWQCLNDRNWSKRFPLKWAQREGRLIGCIQSHSSRGLVVNHCAVAVSPKVPSRVAWQVTHKHTFFLLATVLELWAEICSIDRQTITIRRLWHLKYRAGEGYFVVCCIKWNSRNCAQTAATFCQYEAFAIL